MSHHLRLFQSSVLHSPCHGCQQRCLSSFFCAILTEEEDGHGETIVKSLGTVALELTRCVFGQRVLRNYVPPTLASKEKFCERNKKASMIPHTVRSVFFHQTTVFLDSCLKSSGTVLGTLLLLRLQDQITGCLFLNFTRHLSSDSYGSILLEVR